MPKLAGASTFDALLSNRNNALNLIRLFLAMMVLVAHAWPYADISTPAPRIAEDSLGGWAVAGFFGISGYLVTLSMVRSRGPIDYLKRRALRIFPAFWVCLLVIAFIFAPVSFLLEHNSLNGFFRWTDGPLSYVLGNSMLVLNQSEIANTLEWSIIQIWNPSLWTIAYEFGAYFVIMIIILGVRFLAADNRIRWIVLALWVITVLIHMALPHMVSIESFNMLNKFFKLLAYFFGGALVLLFQDKIPVNTFLAISFLLATLLLTAWEPRWMGQASAPLFTYFLLWAGARMPSFEFVRSEDLSYGLYIYAFPLTQLLYQIKLADYIGSLGFLLVLTLASLAAAALSWFLVEKPALSLIRWSRPQPFSRILQLK